VLATDDADTAKSAVKTVGLKHQISPQHVLPNALRLVADVVPGMPGHQDAGTGGKPATLSSAEA
jgi:hypothetical protein